MLEFEFQNLTVYMLVFARMTGMIAFNPIFSRRNIPARVRAGFILCMTMLLAPTIASAHLSSFGEPDVLLGMFREVFVGFACAYVFQMFYYMLFFAGDLMDTQFGLSMAKVFDPSSSVQMSVSGNLLNIFFMLYLFATDSHLLLIKIISTSYMVVPVGAAGIQWEISGFMLNLFLNAFSMVFRLALPFIAAEFILELSMGVLMKLIPQIHVFVINIQFKILLGMVLLLLFARPISGFVDNYQNLMFQSMQQALYALFPAR